MREYCEEGKGASGFPQALFLLAKMAGEVGPFLWLHFFFLGQQEAVGMAPLVLKKPFYDSPEGPNQMPLQQKGTFAHSCLEFYNRLR